MERGTRAPANCSTLAYANDFALIVKSKGKELLINKVNTALEYAEIRPPPEAKI